jgi:hypothetical protein
MDRISVKKSCQLTLSHFLRSLTDDPSAVATVAHVVVRAADGTVLCEACRDDRAGRREGRKCECAGSLQPVTFPVIVLMPRNPRASQAGYCYHFLNPGNGRRTIFHKDGDFAALATLLCEVGERVSVRLLAYCLLPNHFHLTLWPCGDGDLSDYMRWVLTALFAGKSPGKKLFS